MSTTTKSQVVHVKLLLIIFLIVKLLPIFNLMDVFGKCTF